MFPLRLFDDGAKAGGSMLRSTVLTAGIAILLMAGCGQDQSSSGSRTVEVKGNPRIDLDRAYSIGDFLSLIHI